MEEKVETTL